MQGGERGAARGWRDGDGDRARRDRERRRRDEEGELLSCKREREVFAEEERGAKEGVGEMCEPAREREERERDREAER